MTRQEHLDWCKKRAIAYLDNGDVNQAWASMASDMAQHLELSGHPAIGLGMQMLMSGHLSSDVAMRNFILGFN